MTPTGRDRLATGATAGAGPRVVVLAGGVGGSKLVAGLAAVLAPSELLTVVNTGDDFVHLGLSISPDLDTVVHRLAGVHDPVRGWGRADESWMVMEAVADLGGPDWFRLGDRDLATHMVRTHRRRAGATLTAVTHDLCRALGVEHPVVPMTDDPVATHLRTDDGWLGFQEWFVARRSEPPVHELAFRGAADATADPDVVDALVHAELVVLAPSNPFLSIDPILAIPGLRAALDARTGPVVAVSPIVGGRALKGPAARLLADFSLDVSALGVADHLGDVLTGMVVDTTDADLVPDLRARGLHAWATDTVMDDPATEAELARWVVDHAVST